MWVRPQGCRSAPLPKPFYRPRRAVPLGDPESEDPGPHQLPFDWLSPQTLSAECRFPPQSAAPQADAQQHTNITNMVNDKQNY